MSINLDEIEKALGEATQGKWVEVRVGLDAVNIETEEGQLIIGDEGLYSDANPNFEQDASLIINAPEWLRLLVERVRKYERLEETVMAFLDLQHNMAPYGHMIDEMYKDIAALNKKST